MAYNIPDLPFSMPGNMDRFLPSSHRGRPSGGMRPQGPVDRFDESMGERSGNMPFVDRIRRLLPGGQIPPELLEMLMAQLMGGQGGGGPQRPPMGGQRPPMGRPQMGGQRPPMGGGRPPMGRPPMGGQGGGRPPVIKMEDLVRALSGGGGQRPAPQANMPVPQARR